MKKASFFVLFLLLFYNCSDPDKINDFYFQTLPVEDVIMPEAFVSGDTYQIQYSYIRPTNCYVFNDLFYQIDGNQRIVAVINTVFENSGNGNACIDLDNELITRHFDFIVNNEAETSYVFKFWHGKDASGDDIYLTFEIPVIED